MEFATVIIPKREPNLDIILNYVQYFNSCHTDDSCSDKNKFVITVLKHV